MKNTKSKYEFGWHKPEATTFKTPKGLNRGVIEAISEYKQEPEWMKNFRLQALVTFEQKMVPTWGADLTKINFDNLYYYINPADKKFRTWKEVPKDIKDTYDKIGIPQAEKQFLAGVGAQYDSEMIYHSLKSQWEKQGVIFLSTDDGLAKYPDIFREYFGTVIPPSDNKFAALNSAVWSGGSFVYVPKGVQVTIPLQAYFRINAANMGQFERTLIIAEEGSSVHYVEGCTAPIYSTDSLHAAVVEIIVKKGARVRYTTIQNWSNNVYNLVTKRMMVGEEGIGEWIDGNLGCLRSGSTVTTPIGIKKIEDVEVGDKVLSYDENKSELCFRTITKKKFSGMRQVHKVTAGQRQIYVTSNHPFYSYNYDKGLPKKLTRYKLGYVRADNLKQAIVPSSSIGFGVGYKLVMPMKQTIFLTRNQYADNLSSKRKRKIRVRLPKETNPDLMWLFGLFVGDGSIEKKYGVNKEVVRWAKLGFSVPTSDRAYDKLLKIMKKLIPGTKPTTRKDGIQSTWNSIELVEYFEKNGFESGARKKSVPDWVYSVTEEERMAFVAGYLDSDGTLTIGRNVFAIKSVNKMLISQTAKLLTTLGISSLITKTMGSEVVIMGYKSIAHDVYKVEFSVDKRLISFVCKETQLKSKLLKNKRNIFFKKVGRTTIQLPDILEVRDVAVSEASTNVVPTWDIEVEETNNFVSEGFIVHNSKITMKYPSVILNGKGARGDILSLAFAGAGQHLDAGGKAIHLAPYTSSTITSKSVSIGGGRSSYRGMVKIVNGAAGSKSFVRCDALLLDELSRSDTYPVNIINEQNVTLGHEASVSKIGEQQLFYLKSRGLTEAQATALIVNGFIEPIVKELPLEYAVELNRLINLSMEGSVG